MEFSRPESWSGYPFPSPGDLPSPGTEPRSPDLYVDPFPAEPPGKGQECWCGCPIPFLGRLPVPGIKPGLPALQADSLPAELPGNPH